MSPTGWLPDFAAVAALGASVGVGELVSRYRDEPGRVLLMMPSWIYLGLNAMLSCLALILILIYGWTPEVARTNPPSVELASRCTRVLLAGLGAMAFFRSAVFTLRRGGQDVGVGPVMVFQSVLSAVDAAVDRHRGESRDALVRRVMGGVSFERAYELLPAYCLTLLQHLPEENQRTLGEKVVQIRRMKQDDEAKGRLLGLILINAVGESLLEKAVASLGPKIKGPITTPMEDFGETG